MNNSATLSRYVRSKWQFLIFLAVPTIFPNLVAQRAYSETITVAGGTIDIQFQGSATGTLKKISRKWVENSARAVAVYYQKFPVKHLVLRITPVPGRAPRNGETFGWNGALITIGLGKDATEVDLSDDWLLVHEMTHLALPNVEDTHHWLEEGLATYVEPIARARAGFLTPERIWREMVDSMPQGEPEPGDQGLDRTHTWGRTYWGGALFCLRADVEIRRRTNNRFGLEQALRAILADGGSIESSWKLDKVIAVGDSATGVQILRELYDGMKDRAITVDLPALWKELGVVRSGRTVAFDDKAPLAFIRKAITNP